MSGFFLLQSASPPAGPPPPTPPPPPPIPIDSGLVILATFGMVYGLYRLIKMNKYNFGK